MRLIVFIGLFLWLVLCDNSTNETTANEESTNETSANEAFDELVTTVSNDTYFGFISIRGKLLAEISENTEVNIEVGFKEVFKITLGSVTPYRWVVDTPRRKPFIKCRQKIIDKEDSSDSAEEVIQIFQCRSKYRGYGYMILRIESIDPRVPDVFGLEAKINIRFRDRKVGDTLHTPISNIVPTLPTPDIVPKEVLESNPYNKWRPKKKKEEVPSREDFHDDYYNEQRSYDYDNFDDDDDDFDFENFDLDSDFDYL